MRSYFYLEGIRYNKDLKSYKWFIQGVCRMGVGGVGEDVVLYDGFGEGRWQQKEEFWV